MFSNMERDVPTRLSEGSPVTAGRGAGGSPSLHAGMADASQMVDHGFPMQHRVLILVDVAILGDDEQPDAEGPHRRPGDTPIVGGSGGLMIAPARARHRHGDVVGELRPSRRLLEQGKPEAPLALDDPHDPPLDGDDVGDLPVHHALHFLVDIPLHFLQPGDDRPGEFDFRRGPGHLRAPFAFSAEFLDSLDHGCSEILPSHGVFGAR